jgi:hypothetical protein
MSWHRADDRLRRLARGTPQLIGIGDELTIVKSAGADAGVSFRLGAVPAVIMPSGKPDQLDDDVMVVATSGGPSLAGGAVAGTRDGPSARRRAAKRERPESASSAGASSSTSSSANAFVISDDDDDNADVRRHKQAKVESTCRTQRRSREGSAISQGRVAEIGIPCELCGVAFAMSVYQVPPVPAGSHHPKSTKIQSAHGVMSCPRYFRRTAKQRISAAQNLRKHTTRAHTHASTHTCPRTHGCAGPCGALHVEPTCRC